jgi:hypothetical protein
MSSTLTELLESIETLLAKVSNPRIACENKCNRSITLQYSQWDDPGEYAFRWNCDAAAECGYGNEHFCRFPPLLAEGQGETPDEAARRCLSQLTALLEDRLEAEAADEEDDEF